MAKTARSLQLHCLGPGDLTTLAEAYRARAASLGYRVTWEQKLAERPQATGLFGACNFKLWHALARRIDENLVEQVADVMIESRLKEVEDEILGQLQVIDERLTQWQAAD